MFSLSKLIITLVTFILMLIIVFCIFLFEVLQNVTGLVSKTITINVTSLVLHTVAVTAVQLKTESAIVLQKVTSVLL